jgi:hypothetical protein
MPSANALVTTLILIVVSIAGPACAATPGQSILDRLEERLFSHAYVQETQIQRLSRLEQFVYGETKKGPLAVRINALKCSVVDLNCPKNKSMDSDDAGSNKPATPEPNEQVSSLEDQAETTVPANLTKGTGSYAPGSPAYRVCLTEQFTALELAVFGKSSEQEPLPIRIRRLEDTIAPGNEAVAHLGLTERLTRLKSVLQGTLVTAEEQMLIERKYISSPNPDLAANTTTNQSTLQTSAKKDNFLKKFAHAVAKVLAEDTGYGYASPYGYPTYYPVANTPFSVSNWNAMGPGWYGMAYGYGFNPYLSGPMSW